MTCLVFVGTATNRVPHFEAMEGRGIHVLGLDESNGQLTELSITDDAINPHYLAFDAVSHTLYAISEVVEWSEGQIASYRFDPVSARLTLQDRKSSLEHLACFTSVSNDHRHIFVANYAMPLAGMIAGSAFVVYPVAGKTIGQETGRITYEGNGPRVDRQERSHPHCIAQLPDGSLSCADIGTNEVIFYAFDEPAGAIAERPDCIVRMPPGSGPRHLCHTKDGSHIFVINEMAATVSVLVKQGKGYVLHDSLSVLPAGIISPDHYAAAILLSSDERGIYVSNRRPDCGSLLKIDDIMGKSHLHGCWDSGGKTPGSMAISSNVRFLLVGNQDGGKLSIFSIENLGKLTLSHNYRLQAPMCVTLAMISGNVSK